jgi:hypothetical protein
MTLQIPDYEINLEKLTEKEKQVVDIVTKAYIEGIHRTQDIETIKSGFHREFTMLVLEKDDIVSVSLHSWMPRIEEMKKTNPTLWSGSTDYKFHSVDITNNIASIKMSVWKNNEYFSTDLMLLYKLSDGWKIVSKIFTF